MYRIHKLGEWQRDDLRTWRTDPVVTEHQTLDDMHPFDRAHFQWMLEAGEIVIHLGDTVYQIDRGQ